MAGRIVNTREVRPMVKKLLVVCVVLLLATTLSSVKAQILHSALYDWWYDPATDTYATWVSQIEPTMEQYWVGTKTPEMQVYVQVWEKVHVVVPDSVYEYTYTVHNDGLIDHGGLWCWGFETVKPAGYIPGTWVSPENPDIDWQNWQGVTPPSPSNPYDCAWDDGVQYGWITQTYSAPGIPYCNALDNFKYQSTLPPFTLYLAYAHDNRANPTEPSPWKAKGWISGPIPEPGTLILLGLGVLGFLPFFRRKKK